MLANTRTIIEAELGGDATISRERVLIAIGDGGGHE